MGSFVLLDHTADVGVLATGRTLAEALAWLAKGMFSVIADMDTVESRASMEVSVVSGDRDSLAVDWLNELLFRFETEGFLPKDYAVTVDEAESSLVARCMGEPIDTERHGVGTAVKAATYHNLEVAHDGEWRIRVFLDV